MTEPATQLSKEQETMFRVLRSTRALGVITAVALLSVVAASSASAAETKTFTGTKNCASWPSTHTCLITESSLKVVVGATVIYTAVVFFSDHFTSPVRLAATDEQMSTATGRCTFFFAGPTAGNGHCDYWSGTDRLAGFHASMGVGSTGTPRVYSLSGTYWFDRDHDA
jgi:hypothetical protein